MTSSEVPTVPLNEVPGEFDDSVRAAAEKAGAILLDVREPDEWELGHAPGAVHIPVDDIPARLDELDYDAQLYVICRQGGRSFEAVKYLTHVGFDAVCVVGGMVEWQRTGRPLVGEGEHEPKIY
ncbi:rhodanese-like domain-containing protein [Nocardia cyriacigeorgica]|uniref:rhodanese-like domain-containing protein n=1 Tax=Nocardia cyriacigeorgica TaxID=135487 RepID=UPI000305914F|nr:rhodanese-like domain-containing protein [Nocardia cyriacigeorgica]TLF60827.1 rhodanese-like domain-containing protein [Nocardia cyriacigeorgica]